MARRVETLANLAIITVCVLIATQLVTGALHRTPSPSAPPARVTYQPGERLPTFPAVDFTRADQTLLLVVRDGCHYCEASMPFYRTLTEAVRGNEQAVQLAAVTPGAPDAGRQYLQRYGVSVALVSQSSLNQLKVPGTPTLILADKNGIVSQVWVGQLNESDQSAVLKALRRQKGTV